MGVHGSVDIGVGAEVIVEFTISVHVDRYGFDSGCGKEDISGNI